MAFFCAEEPSAFRVPPLGQSDVAELLLDEDEPPEPELGSEPQAVSAMEPTSATLASWPRRWIFTVFKPLNRGKSWRAELPDAAKVGRPGDGVARRR
jgi:hypothetical protein